VLEQRGADAEALAVCIMNVLVLGGTLFLGRHVVTAARAHGHNVTIFTRGRTNPTVHSDVEMLRGDRDHDLRALDGKAFDLVIDTSAYHPRHIELVASALGATHRYVLISTASVYREFPAVGASEESATHEPLWDARTEVGPATYGP
jgi:2'-hydroxyisoflavone reductase